MGASASVGVAGCIGGSGDVEENGGESLSEHPVARDLTDWPTVGADPFEASETLVVLDDPSCPRCAAFHDEVLPEIEANIVDERDGSVVVRPYPVVYDWGPGAANTLEGAFIEGGEDAFWGKLEHYFENQGEIDTGNVYEKGEEWLAANTELDAEAVVSNARDGGYEDRVQATLDAGEDADAGGTTPVVYMFQDGELRATGTGRLSYTTIENSLNL